VNRRSVNIDTRYLPTSLFLGEGAGGRGGWLTSQFDWPISPKKMKLLKLLKIEGYVLMYIGPPLRPAYIDERKTIFGKTYGMKVRCLYEERLGEHIVNLGNILRTH
jgi:hypothetical protein